MPSTHQADSQHQDSQDTGLLYDATDICTQWARQTAETFTWPEGGYRRPCRWLSRQQHRRLRNIPRLQYCLQHALLAALLFQYPERRALKGRQQQSATIKLPGNEHKRRVQACRHGEFFPLQTALFSSSYKRIQNTGVLSSSLLQCQCLGISYGNVLLDIKKGTGIVSKAVGFRDSARG